MDFIKIKSDWVDFVDCINIFTYDKHLLFKFIAKPGTIFLPKTTHNMTKTDLNRYLENKVSIIFGFSPNSSKKTNMEFHKTLYFVFNFL